MAFTVHAGNMWAHEYLEDGLRWEFPKGTPKSIADASTEDFYINQDVRTQKKSLTTGERGKMGEEESEIQDIREEDAGQLEEKWQRHKERGDLGELTRIKVGTEEERCKECRDPGELTRIKVRPRRRAGEPL
ncbi:hypothetical protein NDU88_004775 [Pleurodeles waltl]|uniref:Uncharacterized protein n=1 Tax=Pleurodeles waltl TaxID=8319 RepID=A0AAV7TTE7_PLEWA|nr:hypothetical protein NDU88_004775 [Pleurodeles waltl]